MKFLRSLSLALLAVGAAADDCSSYTSCTDCPAGCTWINRWDSTGWHCIDDNNVDTDSMLITDSTDCDCLKDPDTSYPYKTCDKCNQNICGWCPYTCMADTDQNKKICNKNSLRWTGSMDDCKD